MLSRRWIVNATLIAIIAALIYSGTGFDKKDSEQADSGISSLSPADITRIEIEAGEVQLQLLRDDNGWRIDTPIQWPAYDANVGRLLSIIELDASPVGEAREMALDKLGLEPPVARLQFNDTRLLFGATNNIGERRYLLVDSTLYLVPDVHLAFATQGLSGMVDRRLLPADNPVASLKLPDFDIVQAGDKQWRSSRQPEFTQGQLQQLIDNWQGLQASRVKLFENGESALLAIEARLSDGTVIDFLLLSVSPEIIIANPKIGLQYHFRADYHDQLITIADNNDDS